MPGADGSAYPASSVGSALRERSPVTYTTNGNRVTDPASYLRKLAPAMRRCGITRVGDISHLPMEVFPVFQACRPGILGHHSTGQNTGGQGKGPTKEQAQISAIMESIEGYCAEPRHVALIRAAYRELKRQHVVLHPARYVQFEDDRLVEEDEPVMWTEAYSIELRRSVLVPAETVFVPFSPTDFDTLPHFPRSTNGLASGATILEAVTHGLYEVLERHFLDLHERGGAKAVLVDAARLERVSAGTRRFLHDYDDVFAMGVFFLMPQHASGVVTALCRMRHRDSGLIVQGSGCSSASGVAIERSISEAIQAFAVVGSGSREDLAHPRDSLGSSVKKKRRSGTAAPSFRDTTFDDLRDELRFLAREVHRLGYPNIFVALLTRVGIEVPVTKVIVPGMAIPAVLRRPIQPSMLELNRLTRLRYGVDLGSRTAH